MTNFPKNLQLTPSPDMYTYVCVSGGKKCKFFEIFVILFFSTFLYLKEEMGIFF